MNMVGLLLAVWALQETECPVTGCSEPEFTLDLGHNQGLLDGTSGKLTIRLDGSTHAVASFRVVRIGADRSTCRIDRRTAVFDAAIASVAVVPPKPKPKGWIRVDGAPEGALVRVIDVADKTADKYGRATVECPPGTHAVEVSKDHYVPASLSVKVEDGKVSSVTTKLDPYVQVRIVTHPAGLEVRMGKRSFTSLGPSERASAVVHEVPKGTLTLLVSSTLKDPCLHRSFRNLVSVAVDPEPAEVCINAYLLSADVFRMERDCSRALDAFALSFSPHDPDWNRGPGDSVFALCEKMFLEEERTETEGLTPTMDSDVTKSLFKKFREEWERGNYRAAVEAAKQIVRICRSVATSNLAELQFAVALGYVRMDGGPGCWIRSLFWLERAFAGKFRETSKLTSEIVGRVGVPYLLTAWEIQDGMKQYLKWNAVESRWRAMK